MTLRPGSRSTALFALAVVTTGVSAQDVGGGALVIEPSFSVSEQFTDNRDLRSSGREAEAITRISPGVRVVSRSGRVQGSLDYTLNGLLYARDSSRNEIQHSLAAAFNAAVVERHAFVSARASISQQSLSAFGVQPPGDGFANDNRTEVRQFEIAPTLRGNIGGLVDVQMRANHSRSSTTSSSDANSTVTGYAFQLSGRTGPLGWSADLSDQTTNFDRGRETGTRRMTVGANYVADVDLRLNARVGRETNDVRQLQNESSNTYGFGVDWTPTPRTSLNAQWDKRFYGNGFSVSAQHRMRRTLFRLSTSRSASGDSSSDGLQLAEQYERLFRDLAPLIPDPVQRDREVRAFLATQGGSVRRAASLQRRTEFGVVWTGIRMGFSGTAFVSETSRLDRVSGAQDDLSRTGVLKQDGYSLSGSYRLTPSTSLQLNYTATHTGAGLSDAGNDQRNINLSLNSELSMRMSFALQLRHVKFDSLVRPYTENGGTASLRVRF